MRSVLESLLEIRKSNKLAFTNAKGSSLLMALTLSTIVTLSIFGFLSFALVTTHGAMKSLVQADFNSLVNQVNSLMQREDSCRVSFGGPLSPFSTIPIEGQGFSPGTITLPAQLNVQIFYPANSAPLQTFIATGGGSSYGMLTNVTATLKATSLISANVYAGQLIIQAKAPDGSTFANQNPMNITLRLNANNQIVSCSSITFGNGGSVPIPVCNTSQGQALYSDGTTITCKQVVCISPTPNFVSWNPDGSALCH